jgi:hypothetical protein
VLTSGGMRPPPRRIAPALLAFLLLAPASPAPAMVPTPAGATAPLEPAAPPPSPGAVRLTVEAIAVDRRGTWSIGTDVADLFPGSTGVLKKSATLIGREEKSPREMVQLEARLTPALHPSAGCALRVDAETRRVLSGARAGTRPTAPDRVSTSVVLKEDEERLVEVYVSPYTQARLALKIRCGAPGPPIDAAARFVDLSLSVSRAEDEKDFELLKGNQLRALVGREASDLASFNVPLPPSAAGAKRYRLEKIEIALAPLLVSGGRIQIEIGARGEIATVSAADPAVSHPIDRHRTAVLASGEAESLEIEVRSSGPDEGWSRLRYRLEVVPRF